MQNFATSYKITGLMSGTSLDGLDIANCLFECDAQGIWHYRIASAKTVPYPTSWTNRLKKLPQVSGEMLALTDLELGEYFGKETRKFLRESNFTPQYIASHGHTVFHQPEKKFTCQIGNGWRLALQAGIPVINDFRSLDVALGGQGAPLVPIGDRLLFSDYTYCLNLGGIANISTQHAGKSIASDIAAANMALNYLAQKEGKAYDDQGKMAVQGCLSNSLLDKLNALPFYRQKPPKSLGYEWVQAAVIPLLDTSNLTTHDQLYTYTHHLCQEIGRSVLALNIPTDGSRKMLVTGGGAYNLHLINRLQQVLAPLHIQVVVPDSQLIDFKEALIFAFLAALRLRKAPTALASVTGAEKDSVGGTMFEIL